MSEEGEFWPDVYGQIDKYGQIEPHHDNGGGGGGWGGGSGGGSDIVDGEWGFIDEPQEFDAEFYARAHNEMPEEYGNKFHTWQGRAVTEAEFDRLRHIDFVEKTGGRETGLFSGWHTTDFGGWDNPTPARTPRGLPQFQGRPQPRQLPGGHSAPRLMGRMSPQIGSPNYPQLTDGGSVAYAIIGAVLGGIARIFGWK